MAHDPHDIDWHELLGRHDADPDDDFPGWRDALDLLDVDPAAQAEAEDVDPLMMFRRLPEPEVGADDIAAMKQAVASARRARAVEEVAADRLDAAPVVRFDRLRRLASTQPARWFAAAAAIVVAVGGLWTLDETLLRDTLVEPAPVMAAVSDPADDAFEVIVDATSPLTRSMPLVEEIGDSPSEMMQVDTDDLSLVVVYVAQHDAADDRFTPDA
ncbi:MAG: hypothetical protein AAGE94_26145 [Acidobacteriota bacterium]